jgi:hypothetical protein
MMKQTALRLIMGIAIICTSTNITLAQDIPADGGEGPINAQQEGEGGDPYNVYNKGLFKEVYIDQDYKLFEVRKYQGVVPGRDKEELTGEPSSKRQKITIRSPGMEQQELFTRIFLVADGFATPWVYDNFAEVDANPGTPYQIIMELAGAKVPRRVDRLPIITRAFNTPVMQFQVVYFDSGAKLIITLKRKARYLPGQDGNVLYVDVER